MSISLHLRTGLHILSSEHTHTSTHTQNRIRVASFFTQPATRVGNARHKQKKKRRKQLINLDDSADDDTDDSDDDSAQYTHNNTTHTSPHGRCENNADSTHGRGHPPTVQSMGQTMPSRGNYANDPTAFLDV